MAAEITAAYGVEVALVKGQAGVFDVLDGKDAVFSKHEQQRFPENAEVIEALRERS